jgi:hypothetical protein
LAAKSLLEDSLGRVKLDAANGCSLRFNGAVSAIHAADLGEARH